MGWKVDVQHDLKVMKIYHWKKQAKIRNEWTRIIEQTETHRVVTAEEEEEEEEEEGIERQKNWRNVNKKT
jgi:hypothetical protein